MGKLLALSALICIIAAVESKFSCDKICSRRRVRVCDQHGVLYRNLCEFQKAKKCAGGNTRLVKNSCDKFEEIAGNRQANNVNCAMSSSEEMPAGCGNRQQNRGRKPVVTVTPEPSYRTALITEMYCDENCPLVFDPVCGSDGITYPSKCVLDALSCSREKEAILLGQPHTKLVAVSKGQCPIPTANPPRVG